VGFRARVNATHDSPLEVLRPGARVVVRLSRSAGLPEWLPDPCGLSLRVEDAYGPGRHQDLLMVSSGGPPGLRHLISPARGFLDRPYSTLLPYRVGGRLMLVGARSVSADGHGPSLEDLRGREIAGLRFEVVLAQLAGAWRPVATLELGERLDPEAVEQLEFNPVNTGGDLELAWGLNRLRGPAYDGSQDGRPG
jgi:hypothetical protein